MQDKTIGRLIGAAIIAILVIVVVLSSFGKIEQNERGVKTSFGKVVGVIEPGAFFKIPFVQQVHKISVKTYTVSYEKENPLTGASKDLQSVNIAVVANYHIDPTKVSEIYTKFGSSDAFDEQVVRPTVRDNVKAVGARFTAEELISKRTQFGTEAVNQLNEKLSEKNVVFEQGNITDIAFSPDFTAAIESKVTAVQNAEAQKNKLEQVKYEAEQTITTAQATAEAQRISSAALASQGGADYVKLKAIEKWNGEACITSCFGSTSGPLPIINLAK